MVKGGWRNENAPFLTGNKENSNFLIDKSYSGKRSIGLKIDLKMHFNVILLLNYSF